MHADFLQVLQKKIPQHTELKEVAVGRWVDRHIDIKPINSIQLEEDVMEVSCIAQYKAKQ